MTAESIRKLVESEIAGDGSLTNAHGRDLRRCLVFTEVREYDDCGGGQPMVEPPPSPPQGSKGTRRRFAASRSGPSLQARGILKRTASSR